MVSYGHIWQRQDLCLVGGLEHGFYFPYIENNILITPTDFNIFQRGSNHQPDVI
jgi:hypothetical protein